jgi:hypothetical protein
MATPEPHEPHERDLAARISIAARWLAAINCLDLRLDPERFLVEPEVAWSLLPDGGPRTGLLALEEGEEVFVGLYVHPADAADDGTIVEETSHLLCLAWHVAQGRRVSRLLLELQAEVDRYALVRLRGGDPLRHFECFVWADDLEPADRERYEVAHRVAHRYCRGLSERFPGRCDLPGLLTELRGFYRAGADQKLRVGRS